MIFKRTAGLMLLAVLTLAGCMRQSGAPEVIVYAALDEEFSAPVLEDFTKRTNIEVRGKYDTESTKTVALAEEILAEAQSGRPRCDVFWNNEILHTLRLEKAGLLDAYMAAGSDDFPAQYRSPDETWHGFAARARVLLVNTNLVPEDERPRSIRDLIDPKWQGKVGLAKPLFGTTATHAACLFAAWGDDEAKDFFRQLKSNAKVLSGNRQVAQAVGSGQLAFGLTDTDDAMIETSKGSSVAIVYPDQGEGELGTLFIPNTLAIIKGSAHPAEARRLVDHLLSPAVERVLAEGPSAQIPLNTNWHIPAKVETPKSVKPMEIDFHQAADHWDTASAFLRETFTVD